MIKKDTTEYIEEVNDFIEFVVDNLKIFKLTSTEKELFLLYDIEKRTYIQCNPRSLSGSLLNRISEKGKTYSKVKRSDMIDILIERNLIKEIHNLGYEVSDNEIFEYDDKEYFNMFKKGKFEAKYSNSNVKLKIDEANKKYEFRFIKLLIRHLIGDEKVFYEENLKVLENKKQLTKEEEFDFSDIIDKIKSNDVNVIKSYFQDNLKKLNNDVEYNFLINKKVDYFYKWFGFIIQNPQFKLPNGLVFQSVPGVGKDRLIEWIVEEIFGVNNIKSIGQDDLGKFNDFVKGVRFVICNEIEFSRTNTSIYNTLKRLMTNKHLAVQGKFKEIENIVNYAHFLFFGNAENIMKIEKGDRRFTVFKQDFKLPKTISRGLSPEMSPGILEAELGQFTQFLYSLEINFEEIEKPLITAEKEEIMSYHKSDIDSFLDDMKDYPNIKVAVENLTSNQDERQKFNKYKNSELLPNDIVFQLFLLNNKHKQIKSMRQSNSFHKVLSKRGFSTSEPIHNPILGFNTRHKFTKEIFPNFELNEINSNYNSSDITIDLNNIVESEK